MHLYAILQFFSHYYLFFVCIEGLVQSPLSTNTKDQLRQTAARPQKPSGPNLVKAAESYQQRPFSKAAEKQRQAKVR